MHEPAVETARHLEQLSSLANDQQFPIWIRFFLAGIRDHVSEEYLLAGFRLATRFRPEHRFDRAGQCTNFPEQIVEDLAIEFAERDSYSGWLAMALWERCAQQPGLADVIRSSKWRHFAPAACRYFEFLQGITYHDLSEKARQSKWTAIRRQIPAIEQLLLSVPATHQAKAVAYLVEWLWQWDEPAGIETRLPAGLRLLRRLATPPFGTSDGAAGTLCWLLDTNDKELQELSLTAPDASFEALEHASIRGNDAGLISWGSYILTRHLALFTVSAFRAAPNKLFRTAKILGGVSYPIRSQIIKRCQEHPLFRANLLEVPIAETCETIERSLGKAHINPIPARLRAWLKGEVNLSPGSIERHRRVLTEKLLLTRLDLIEQSVFEWLKNGFPIEKVTKNDEHALRLLGSLDDNRRGLRKFLNAYWSGNRDYLSKHPETIAWYRKHTTISRDIWEHGIPFESKEIALSIERDPLEILKLGTYVGSCLGIGGLCAYSAAAALLDVNKQVLYARDRQGRVVGRQLLAVADDEGIRVGRVCLCKMMPSDFEPIGLARTAESIELNRTDLCRLRLLWRNWCADQSDEFARSSNNRNQLSGLSRRSAIIRGRHAEQKTSEA
jgi:DNA-binding transcriptional ArsR family regulator